LFEETRGVLHTGAEKGKSKKAQGKREEIRNSAALINHPMMRAALSGFAL
jgi:hypothetical protein